MKRRFMDTSYILALSNPGDKNFLVANALSYKWEGFPTLTTDAVLLEVGNGLARIERKLAVSVAEELLTSEDVLVVRLTPEYFDRTLQKYRVFQDKKWGLVDCFSFVVMEEQGGREAFTFDEHFTQAGFVQLR